MDWATRKVLAWRVSNTMDAGFCVEALQDAMARYGKPEIFNTDQGSQFTSHAFTTVLRDAEVRDQHGWPNSRHDDIGLSLTSPQTCPERHHHLNFRFWHGHGSLRGSARLQ
jgi:transposase InsO family protein